MLLYRTRGSQDQHTPLPFISVTSVQTPGTGCTTTRFKQNRQRSTQGEKTYVDDRRPNLKPGGSN